MAVLTAREFNNKNTASLTKQSLGPVPIQKAEPEPVWYLVHPDRGFVQDAEFEMAGEKLRLVDGYTKCETIAARNDLLQQGYREVLEGKQTRRK
jgi:hypothetical protein